MITTKNRRAVGTLGIVAIAAIMMVSVAVTNFSQQSVLAENLPAKKGYVGGSELAINDGAGPSEIIPEFYFKTNAGGDIVFDLTAECATMTHIKGKGKMDSFDGADVGAKVWFEYKYEGTDVWKTIPIGGDAYDDEANDPGKWNFCKQVFAIKTDLNDLIVRCTQAQIDSGDFPECSAVGDPLFVCDADGTPKPGFDAEAECEQSVELFLENSGTRPATALLMNVPNGVHEARVMADLTINAQSNLDPTECSDPEDPTTCDIRTALVIGKRLLIVEDIHLATDADL